MGLERQAEEPVDFQSFRTVLGRLRSFRTLEVYEALREAAAEIDWDRDSFQLYYITLKHCPKPYCPELQVVLVPLRSRLQREMGSQ